MKRREMLAGFGFGSLLLLGAGGRTSEAAPDSSSAKSATSGSGLVQRSGSSDPADGLAVWKYAKVDPAKVADMTYEIYPQGACMYAVTRALLTNIADALRTVDPLAAITVESFPFHMMRYGHGGVGAVGST